MTKAGRVYLAEVGVALLLQWVRWEPIQETISLSLAVQFPKLARRRDISNLVKVVEDSLTKHRVYGDDSQVKRLLVEAVETPWEHGRIYVTLAPYTMRETVEGA